MDNIYTEKQQRLLTEPLYSSWTNPDGKPFLALSNVGLFFAAAEPPLVPDAMLSLDVPPVKDHQEPDHRSYFSWIVGKMPEVVHRDRFGSSRPRRYGKTSSLRETAHTVVLLDKCHSSCCHEYLRSR